MPAGLDLAAWRSPRSVCISQTHGHGEHPYSSPPGEPQQPPAWPAHSRGPPASLTLRFPRPRNCFILLHSVNHHSQSCHAHENGSPAGSTGRHASSAQRRGPSPGQEDDKHLVSQRWTRKRDASGRDYNKGPTFGKNCYLQLTDKWREGLGKLWSYLYSGQCFTPSTATNDVRNFITEISKAL